MRLSRLFIVLCVVWLFAGCALIDSYFLPPPEDTAQELFEAGMDAMGEKDYSDAQEYFNKLKDEFPFSHFALKAELALGDAYYLDEEYLLALDAYKEFEALHPSNENIPYVLYQIGNSNFNLFRSIDTRQENIKEALEYYYRLRETFPNTEYADAAKDRIVECRRKLAEHEINTADIFWRREQYGPAWHRYQYVVENFSDLPKLREYAHRMARRSYFEYQKTLSEEERMRLQESWLLWLKEWL